MASDQIEGIFSDPVAPVNSMLCFGGFINNAIITPPKPDYMVNAVGPSPIPFPPPFLNMHGPLPAAVGRFYTRCPVTCK
jgi:hypothetical protein